MEVHAEMAGVLLRIIAKPGDSVQEGAQLCVLESMKMEIPVLSPVAGTVVSHPVAEGAFVQQGDVLVVLR